MALLTTEFARLHKTSKASKINEGLCIVHNSLGWITTRTYSGITGSLNSVDERHTYINHLLDKGYELIGEMTVPTEVRSQRETQDAIAND